MSETLVLKTNKEPTFWNKEAAIGTFLAFPIGTIIGGLIGQERMKKEKLAGKIVSEKPSFWNKDTLLGGLMGAALAGIATAVVLLSIPTATILSMSTAALGIMTVAAYAVPLAGGLLGGYLGGRSGQSDERKEFAEAKRQQQMTQELGKLRTAEMVQEEALTKNHAQQIELERALAAKQQPAR